MKSGYDTNLAAEFHVLSALHRLGLSAMLTLGNKKAVDIVVAHSRGQLVTIDVKGLAGTTSWPIRPDYKRASDHYFVFVAYVGKIKDPGVSPEVYVVPSVKLKPLVYEGATGRCFVERRRLKKEGSRFRDAWDLVARKRS